MKNAILACAVACALSGCASFDAAVETFNKPETQQALSTVRTITATVACTIYATSTNKKAVVYAVSRDACVISGGSVL